MSDLLKSVIQDLINDRTEQAQVTIHEYITSKTRSLLEYHGGGGLSDDDFEHYEQTLENGIHMALEASIQRALGDVFDAEDVSIDLSGGGGFRTSHDYDGAVKVFGGKKKPTKEQIEAAFTGTFGLDWVEDIDVTVGHLEYLTPKDPEDDPTAKFDIDVQVTFESHERHDDDEDRDEDDED